MNYVIIGDVHGMLEPLEVLLQKLGFFKQDGIYQHPKYIAIFVGDLVDRGKHQRGVLELVRAMVEYGSATAILGNHEYYVISFYSINPLTQHPFKKHTPELLEYRHAFMHDYPFGSKAADDIINWMKSLPLFLELDGFRVAHAAWNAEIIAQLQQRLGKAGQLSHDDWQEALTEGTSLKTAVTMLLQGVYISMPLPTQPSANPAPPSRLSKRYRLYWWRTQFSAWKHIVCAKKYLERFEDMPVPPNLLAQYNYDAQQPPLFLGHYWFTGEPTLIQKNIACVDYSACVGGQLTAYVWNQADHPQKEGLREDRFVSVPSKSFLDEEPF
jgi:hypothetical protein